MELELSQVIIDIYKTNPALAIMLAFMFVFIVAVIVGIKITKSNNQKIGETKTEVVKLNENAAKQLEMLEAVLGAHNQDLREIREQMIILDRRVAHLGEKLNEHMRRRATDG